jgi:hypothetical protein
MHRRSSNSYLKSKSIVERPEPMPAKLNYPEATGLTGITASCLIEFLSAGCRRRFLTIASAKPDRPGSGAGAASQLPNHRPTAFWSQAFSWAEPESRATCAPSSQAVPPPPSRNHFPCWISTEAVCFRSIAGEAAAAAVAAAFRCRRRHLPPPDSEATRSTYLAVPQSPSRWCPSTRCGRSQQYPICSVLQAAREPSNLTPEYLV